jgi:U2 small nuclear ribonucleoprotein A'
MRLTVDILNRAEQRTNCLGERELVLSGLGIPAIENTASILSNGEEFDCLDISNNLLLRLDNFSRWHRLSNLLASGNRIESIDGRNFSQNLPNLQSVTLSHNNISSLAEIQALGNACKDLKFLDLTGNPVTSKSSFWYWDCALWTLTQGHEIAMKLQ